MAGSLAYNARTQSTHFRLTEPMNRAYIMHRDVRLPGGASARGIGGED